MEVRFQCSCGQLLQAASVPPGQHVTCPSCRQLYQIPLSSFSSESTASSTTQSGTLTELENRDLSWLPIVGAILGVLLLCLAVLWALLTYLPDGSEQDRLLARGTAEAVGAGSSAGAGDGTGSRLGSGSVNGSGSSGSGAGGGSGVGGGTGSGLGSGSGSGSSGSGSGTGGGPGVGSDRGSGDAGDGSGTGPNPGNGSSSGGTQRSQDRTDESTKPEPSEGRATERQSDDGLGELEGEAVRGENDLHTPPSPRTTAERKPPPPAAAKSEAKPLPPTRTAAKSEAKPLPPTRTAAKPEAKPLPPARTAAKPEAKPLPPTRTAAKPEAKPLPPTRTAAKPKVKPLAPTRTAAKPKAKPLPPTRATAKDEQNSNGPLDRFGNPHDAQYSLAKPDEFKGKLLLAWSASSPVDENIFPSDNPLWAKLESMGFKVERVATKGFPLDRLEKADQLWLFSAETSWLADQEYEAIKRFISAGKGVYLLAENEPYVKEAAFLAKELFEATIQGNHPGDKILTVKGRSTTKEEKRRYADGATYMVNDHKLLTGINFIHEGSTVSHISHSGMLQPVLTASNGKILVAVSKDANRRVVVDCGYTRYFYGKTPGKRLITETAGTIRFGGNVAAYLMGKGK